jgi:hypothetical protein
MVLGIFATYPACLALLSGYLPILIAWCSRLGPIIMKVQLSGMFMFMCDRPSRLTDPTVSSKITWVSLTNQEPMVQPSKKKYIKELLLLQNNC